MKKQDIFLILGFLVIVVIGFILMNTKQEKPSYSLPLDLHGDAGLHQLTYSEYQSKIDDGDAFVVILERASCSHCVNYMPVAKEFAENNQLPLYYVDTDTFAEDEWNSFIKSNSFLKKNQNNWGTPTTVLLVGYDAVDYIEGETTADELKKLYDANFKF